MSTKQDYHSLIVYKVIQALKNRNIEGSYCETKEEALQKAIGLIEVGSKVAWGGSQSVEEIGLLDAMKAGNYQTIDRTLGKTPEEVHKLNYEALSADYYLMSSNAITQDGKLVNVDANGNRIAALVFGPKNIIIIAGMNKVVTGENEAMQRARNLAAPMNALRLNKSTPCCSTGLCHNCTNDECLCCQILVTRMSSKKNRIKVILVGENIGF